MGRTVSGDSNTFQLTAGAAINGRDAIEIGPEGKAYPVVTTDYAAVANVSYGTAQTSTATGRIFAQTQVFTDVTQSNSADEQRIVQGENGDIFATRPYSTTNGLVLARYSAGGALLGSVTVKTTGAALNPSVLKLSNGNIAVVWYVSADATRYAVYTSALGLVKADTAITGGAGGSTGFHGATALSAGGFAVIFQPSSSLETHLAVYDNTGTAVVSPTNLWTRTGTSGDIEYRIAQLSNGDLAILAHMIGVASGSFTGQWHAVYTTAAVQVAAFTQIYSQQAFYSAFIKTSGAYYAASSRGKGGANDHDVYVFSNSGAQQGTAYNRSDTGMTGTGHLASGASAFWYISSRASDSKVVLAKIPYTGGASATLQDVTTTGTSNYSANIKMFVENGLILALATMNAATEHAMWVMSESTGALVNSASTTIAPSFTSSSQTICVIPGGDCAFIGYYDLATTLGTYIVAGKFSNTSVVGVAAASAAQGDPVNIKQGAGTYICNTLKGTAAVAFDHTTGSTISGNKGTLLTGGVALRGM